MKLPDFPAVIPAAILIAVKLGSASGADYYWVGGSGDWNQVYNWSNSAGTIGTLPGPSDNVLIDQPGAVITHSAGDHSIGHLQSENTLLFSGGTLSVSGGMTLNADLNLTGARAQLLVRNGLVLNGTARVGDQTGNFAAITFEGTQTLAGNGTVVFGVHNSGNALRLSESGSTLTLGPGITVRGQNGNVGNCWGWWGGPTDVQVVNQGSILADVNGGTIVVNAQPFSNQGLAGALNGGTLSVADLALNLGQLEAEAAALNLAGVWTNAGSINVTNATLNLGGSFSVATLGAVQRVGGVVNLTGTLNNAGATLALDAVSGSWVMVGGTIQGGTVTTAGGAELAVAGGSSTRGVLDGVVVNGDLDLSTGWAQLLVRNGLVLNGTARVGDQTGNFAAITFEGTQTLAGNGTVVFGVNNSGNALRLSESGSTLTLGPGITVRGQNGNVGNCWGWWGGPTDVQVVNQGSILADVNGGTIVVNAQPFSNQGLAGALNGGTLSVADLALNLGQLEAEAATLNLAGVWTNAGSINVTNATLNLGGSFSVATLGAVQRVGGVVNLTGTLNNAGATLALDAVSGSWVMVGGTIQGGTVTTAGGAELAVAGGSSTRGVLDGVVVNGDLDLSTGWAQLLVRNGLVLNGTARVGDQTGNFAAITFEGTQTLAGNGTVVFGVNNSGNALRLSESGSTLTLGPGITVRGQNGNVGNCWGWWGGPTDVQVVNQGSILADVNGGTVHINAGTFQNPGVVQAVLGGTLALESPVCTNLGTLEARVGGLLEVNTSPQFNDPSVLSIQVGGIARLSGNLLGATRNADRYVPTGPLVLDGGGSASAPQLFEVMGQDLGNVAEGFDRNFAYGSVALANNTYVRLVDQVHNSRGTGPEALYVNTLVVPSGTTLDLNGLHVYARASQSVGTIAGGSITPVPDSGPIGWGVPSPGSISAPGEIDEWTFFGRLGQWVTVVVDPGSGSALAPYLNYAQVELLDPAANVIATNGSAAQGQPVLLSENNPACGGTLPHSGGRRSGSPRQHRQLCHRPLGFHAQQRPAPDQPAGGRASHQPLSCGFVDVFSGGGRAGAL